MGAISGISGNVNTKSTVGKWSVDSTNDLQAIVASNTKGGTTHLAGNNDWSGEYEAMGYTPSSLPGTALTFVGCLDATKGASGTAIVDEVSIEIDIEGGAPIKHSCKFSSNGALTLGVVSQSADVSDVDKSSSIGCKLQMSDALAAPSYDEVTDIRTMTLTITADNKSYVSSSTAGETKRLEGNLNFAFSFTQYTADPAELVTPGDVQDVKMFVAATDFWHLQWVRFGDVSGLEVNRETGDIVGCTQNSVMEGITDVEGTMTEGFIKTAEDAPSTIWP